ncbi:PH domain protein [Taphrina deformans PYCC 5710]|uniref:PH domain protein n=1 Tax=Taphrina deformans (strain PYCC 5710 / ATCC 11124 / CBS 356.35 / IMI 108563 / JCM 9778 / NBRC 8474) TaxID=1097556 RepID=R4XBV9_TAPDE|nr:PH domain protein [Taphrina deformans PYCC 5710]|eukprot:CCG80830.1 PH domain protein [Taphrina deformans PYCC 5710]
MMASHRRIASESNAPGRRARPLSILSASPAPAARFDLNLPAPFQSIISQLEARKTKLYYEGYLQKCSDYTGSSKSPHEGEWQDVYASLSGTVLSTWSAPELDLADTIGALSKVPPTYINLMDARIEQNERADEILITTLGNKKFRLRSAQDTMDTKKWTLAIRLSAFERSRMQEAYTSNLFLKYSVKETTNIPNGEEKWAGYVDARICGGDVAQTQWTKLWCTVNDHVGRKNLLSKRLSSSSDNGNHERELRFFEDKKSKSPMIIVEGVIAAYACYPEHVSLIESAGMVKVEGNVRAFHARSTFGSDGYALIIPKAPEKSKRLSLSSFSAETPTLAQNILKLLYACWSAFSLYNLPQKLLLNTNHAKALGFGDATLDIQLEQLLGRISSDCSTAEMWRSALREQAVLQSHYTDIRGEPLTPQSPSNPNIFKRSGNERRVVSEGAIVPPFRPLVTSIEEDEELEQGTARAHEPLTPSTALRHDGLGPHIELVGADHHQSVAHEANSVPTTDRVFRAKPYPSSTPSTQQISTKQPAIVTTPSKVDTTSLQMRIARIANRRLSNSNNVNTATSSIPPNTDALPKKDQITDSRPLADAPQAIWRDTRPRTLSSAQVMNETELMAPAPRAQASPMPYEPQRPTMRTRKLSYDSYLSTKSASSAYSAGLDPTALALVSQVDSTEDDNDNYAKLAAEKDGSIYSNDSQTTISEYASHSGDERNDKSRYSTTSLGERVRRRATAIEALDIQRQPSLEVSSNPYARPRQRW